MIFWRGTISKYFPLFEGHDNFTASLHKTTFILNLSVYACCQNLPIPLNSYNSFHTSINNLKSLSFTALTADSTETVSTGVHHWQLTVQLSFISIGVHHWQPTLQGQSSSVYRTDS